MNKEFILFNLNEAKESIEKMIEEINIDKEYCDNDVVYMNDMQHLYWHINTAWNARFSTEKESAECTQENFDSWNEFPTDMILNYEK